MIRPVWEICFLDFEIVSDFEFSRERQITSFVDVDVVVHVLVDGG